jgi:hypothetical protein
MICLRTRKHPPESSSGVLNELSEYTVDFERSAIKSQVLADFVVGWTSPTHKGQCTMMELDVTRGLEFQQL